MGTPKPSIAVVVATHRRPALLEERALPSIVAQLRRPDLVVVVDDSGDDVIEVLTRRAVERLALSGIPCQWSRNVRSSGASGAWNTGIGVVHDHADNPAGWWVAILDDDDAWEADHLAASVVCIAQDDLDVVATPMLRHERTDDTGRCQHPPEALTAEHFLVGNPHIQGSNLLVRLSRLVEAGLFDEGLPSCTDRDLCLRLLDIPELRYGRTTEPTVHHYAEADRVRLSTAGSRAKAEGLLGFWRKYRGRMDAAQRRSFLERADHLFAWRPVNAEEPEVHLVIGIVADSGRPQRVQPLLSDLLRLSHEDGIAGLDVILVENGPVDGTGLGPLTHAMRREGLRLYLVDVTAQGHDALAGRFGDPFQRQNRRLPIATTRSMLQAYTYALARRRPGCVVWLLDDDKRLDALNRAADGVPVGQWLASTLLRFRERGVDVVIGADHDAPPLPAGAVLRVQLVDLLHNLRWFAGLVPTQPFPDRSSENADLASRSREPYHDLSAAGAEHIETPCWWEPETVEETVASAFTRLAVAIGGLLRGEQVFRPIRGTPNANVITAAEPSWHRGGNTFVLSVEALADAPNLAPGGASDAWRRSDMGWALAQLREFGRHVVQAPIPVTHDRSDLSPEVLSPRVLRDDCLGHAAAHALNEALMHGGASLDQLDRESALAVFRVRLERRLRDLSFGLTRSRVLLGAVERELASGCWWTDTAAAEQLRAVVLRLGPPVVALEEAVDVDVERSLSEMGTFLEQIPRTLHAWRQALGDGSALRERLDSQRILLAEWQVRRLLRPDGRLRLLGTGSEAVVLTDDDRVYKLFDSWKVRNSANQRRFLRTLVGKWTATAGLYPIDRIVDDGAHAVLVYPYEASRPYQGGEGPGLVSLLRECREHGVVFDNMHPKNLIVTDQGVRLVDYGSDVRPFSESGFEAMCRRAFVCWRWWERDDLGALLRAALGDPELPDIDGWRLLRDAALAGPPEPELYDRLVSLVEASGAAEVLDYGCGKGRVARRLASTGAVVVGYDPDVALAARWRRDGPGPTLGGRELLARLIETGMRFAASVCSLVLCTIADEAVYADVLEDLARLTAPGGSLVLAVCDPAYTTGGPTPHRRRVLPPDAKPDEVFAWESVLSTGRRRTDVHRPLTRLRSDLERAGFTLERMEQIPTVDTEHMEPASEFLVLVLRNTRRVQPGERGGIGAIQEVDGHA